MNINKLQKLCIFISADPRRTDSVQGLPNRPRAYNFFSALIGVRTNRGGDLIEGAV